MNEQTSENQSNINKHRGHLILHSSVGLMVANGISLLERSALSHAASAVNWRNPMYLLGWLLLLANVFLAIRSALALRKAQSEEESKK